jgi:multidrug resistance efflux pump
LIYRFGSLSRFSLRGIIPIAVCILTAGAIYKLYQQSPEISGIQGIAEAREFTVSSYENGRIISMEVAPGQKVVRNQVLANLDKGTLEQEIKVAEAELRELESQVPAKGKSLEMGGLESGRAFQSDIEKAAGELENARAVCQKIQAELAGTQQEFNRQRDLVQRHLASADRMHILQVQLAALQQESDSCPSQIKTLEARNQAARKRFDEWRFSLEGNSGQNARGEQLQPILLRSQRQQENLRLLKMRAENLVLRSPADGYIAGIHVASGNVVAPGEPLIVVVESNPRQVIAHFDENRLCPVVSGDTVVLRPRNKAASPMQGTVVSVSSTVSQLPQRFWPAPNRPQWGRQLFIRADSSRVLIPGEKFDIIPSPKTGSMNLAAVSANEGRVGKAPGAPLPLMLPSGFLSRTHFELSGIAWIDKMQRYIAVSDDTGREKFDNGSPWVFSIGKDGVVDSEPIVIEGIERIKDLEGIAAAPDGRVYLIASQSRNRKGIRSIERTIFISAHLQERKLIADSQVSFYDLLMEAQRQDPSFLSSLGIECRPREPEPTIEIEGLAWHNGALYLGLKKPLDSSKQALIWKLSNPDLLFRRKSLSGATLYLWKRVSMPMAGSPAGISEILFLSDDAFVLAGTNSKGGDLFYAAETAGQGFALKTLAEYPGLKPEGLCLGPDGRLVVVFDRGEKKPLWVHLEMPR